MIVCGIDGCRGGWVVVTLADGAPPAIDASTRFAELLTRPFDRAAIDMPLGLPPRGIRPCDDFARKMLGNHASRVFTGATRPLLSHTPFARATYDKANRERRAGGETGVSLQLWYILPKIGEADAALRADPALRARLHETHPELVFRRIAAASVASKHTEQGRTARRELLAASFPDLDAWMSRAGRRLLTDCLGARRMCVQPDDIVDACAAALCARDLTHRNALGGEPDHEGIPMRIWF